MALIPVPVPLIGESPRSVVVEKPHFVARNPLRFQFTTAGVNVSVAHDLGRVPAGYLVIGLSGGVSVYDGSAPSSESLLTLRATGAAVAHVLPL